MPKFREGDVVYCIRNTLEDTLTEYYCGLSGNMEGACQGFPMTVALLNEGDFSSVSLSAPQFSGTTWWFHVDDLDFFNLNLENK